MAITNTINTSTVMGDRKVILGTSTTDGTGGDVATGLNTVDIFLATPLGATAAEIAVNETFPLSSGDVTVVTESSVGFGWMAIGK